MEETIIDRKLIPGTRETLAGFLDFVEAFTVQGIITLGMDEGYRFYEVHGNRVIFSVQILDDPREVMGWADFKPVVHPGGHTIIITVYASEERWADTAAGLWEFLKESWNEYLRFIEKRRAESDGGAGGDYRKTELSVDKQADRPVELSPRRTEFPLVEDALLDAYLDLAKSKGCSKAAFLRLSFGFIINKYPGDRYLARQVKEYVYARGSVSGVNYSEHDLDDVSIGAIVSKDNLDQWIEYRKNSQGKSKPR